MKIRDLALLVGLSFFVSGAFAYTPTVATAIPAPSDGNYTVAANNGTCNAGYTPIYPPGFPGAPPGICAYNVPVSDNLCPAGAFTFDGASCLVSPTAGDIVSLGTPGTDVSNPSSWVDWNTGAPPTPDVVSQTQAFLNFASSGSSGSSGSGGSGAVGTFKNFTSVVSSLNSNGIVSDILTAVCVAAGIVLSLAMIFFGGREIDRLLSRSALSRMKTGSGAVWTRDRGMVDVNTWKTLRHRQSNARAGGGNYGVRGGRQGSSNSYSKNKSSSIRKNSRR